MLVVRELERVIPRGKKPKEVYSLIWDLLDRGGKRFRPALSLLSCEAVGGDPKNVLPAAAAVELFHNFTLIHDDLEDNSLMRRGKPCLHVLYGSPLAINAGDGLFMMVWKSFLNLRTTPEKIIKTETILLDSFTRVLEGQAIELGWRGDAKWETTEAEYFKMVEGKTAALIKGACEVGAYLGGGSKKEIRALVEFGRAVGIAFQIQDDILNLIGEEEKYKKEIGGDVSEGKRTLMVIHTLKNAVPTDKKILIKTLNSKTNEKSKITKAISIIIKYNSIYYAKQIAKNIVKKAKSGLAVLKNSDSKKKLIALADFLIERDF